MFVSSSGPPSTACCDNRDVIPVYRAPPWQRTLATYLLLLCTRFLKWMTLNLESAEINLIVTSLLAFVTSLSLHHFITTLHTSLTTLHKTLTTVSTISSKPHTTKYVVHHIPNSYRLHKLKECILFLRGFPSSGVFVGDYILDHVHTIPLRVIIKISVITKAVTKY